MKRKSVDGVDGGGGGGVAGDVAAVQID